MLISMSFLKITDYGWKCEDIFLYTLETSYLVQKEKEITQKLLEQTLPLIFKKSCLNNMW